MNGLDPPGASFALHVLYRYVSSHRCLHQTELIATCIEPLLIDQLVILQEFYILDLHLPISLHILRAQEAQVVVADALWLQKHFLALDFDAGKELGEALHESL